MKKLLIAMVLSGFCLSLTACGVKGPLYHLVQEQPVQQKTDSQ
ncbi:LPS translocon maturation chaperone LptM [Gallibacterium sp. AGMB14963]|nr:lipoprotein [Gallibacterium sp. AGMB14963]MDA3979658.1 lipoprotein [Gallibacterium sp. AGMB14963]